MLLHLFSLLWLRDEWPAWLGPQDERREPVVVTVLTPPKPPGIKGEASTAPVAPRPAPRPRPKPPAPRPAAITPETPAPAPPPPEPAAGPEAADEAAAEPPSDSDAELARRAAEGGETPGEAPAAGALQPGAEARPETGPPSELLYGSALGAPPAGRWRYHVFYGDYREANTVAHLDYSLQLDGDRYTMRSEAKAIGLVSLIYSGVASQSSSGRLTANGLQPERYAEKRGDRRERTVTVDVDKREVRFDGGKVAPWIPGAQDRLSSVMQLGLIARAKPELFVPGQSVELPELTMSEVTPVSYLVRGEELLETPKGGLRALHLERTQPSRQGPLKIEVWLGYDLWMMPVRLRVTDASRRVLDQLIER